MSAQRPSAPPAVLTFAGTDPTGGAGLQADLATIGGMGCHALSVVTAVTVQDTSGVARVVPMDADLVLLQARTVLAEIPVAAIKIGIVGSAANAAAVATVLDEHPDIPVILDPVLASGRGDALGVDDVRSALLEHLVPRATVVTPNSPEARRLASADDHATLESCARNLIDRGAARVLVTGTHEATRTVVNTLYDRDGEIRADRWRRLPGEYHGSGCTLASAIAAAIANGLGIEEAVREGQEFTWHALRSGFRLGHGQALPDRYFWVRATDLATADDPTGDDETPAALTRVDAVADADAPDAASARPLNGKDAAHGDGVDEATVASGQQDDCADQAASAIMPAYPFPTAAHPPAGSAT